MADSLLLLWEEIRLEAVDVVAALKVIRHVYPPRHHLLEIDCVCVCAGEWELARHAGHTWQIQEINGWLQATRSKKATRKETPNRKPQTSRVVSHRVAEGKNNGWKCAYCLRTRCLASHRAPPASPPTGPPPSSAPTQYSLLRCRAPASKKSQTTKRRGEDRQNSAVLTRAWFFQRAD